MTCSKNLKDVSCSVVDASRRVFADDATIVACCSVGFGSENRDTPPDADPQPAHLRVLPFSEPRGRFTHQGGRKGTSAMLTRCLPPYTLDLVVFTFKVVWEGRFQAWFLFFDGARCDIASLSLHGIG